MCAFTQFKHESLRPTYALALTKALSLAVDSRCQSFYKFTIYQDARRVGLVDGLFESNILRVSPNPLTILHSSGRPSSNASRRCEIGEALLDAQRDTVTHDRATQ